MKILVIGASGQIGGACMEVMEAEHEMLGTYFSHPKEGLIKLDFTEGGGSDEAREAAQT